MKKKSKKKQTKKKDNKYNKQKYASFNTNYQVGVRKELLSDIDYIDKLSEEEKDWLNRFLQETVVTNFNHGGENLYKDKEERRKLYTENNKRNADVYSLSKSKGNLYYSPKSTDSSEDDNGESTIADINYSKQHKDDMEDLYNTAIILKKKLSKE